MALVPYNYCNPYNLENNYKTFVINGEYIKINQSFKEAISATLLLTQRSSGSLEGKIAVRTYIKLVNYIFAYIVCTMTCSAESSSTVGRLIYGALILDPRLNFFDR